ncbi:MAG: non-homologous end-joining DNA ligase [Acidimicrobiales bacterium]
MSTAKRQLQTYQKKRNASRTPEPMGDAPPPSTRGKRKRPFFVIQEHHARALHWDFRLERDGILVSWALPKGLPTDPKTNHLAVHVEDHPIEYAEFQGDIPKGEYGAGTVSLWDRGPYDIEKWDEREVKVVLHGRRAKGRYVLFATGGKNWMIHRMDPPAAGYEAMPKFIEPMLALAGRLPADETGWAFEFKWDGVRAIVFVDGGRVRATSRNDKDLSESFPELRAVGDFLGSRSAILDGEIVAFDEAGRPDFGRLQQRLHLTGERRITARARDFAASFLAFDLLYLEGRLLLTEPYDERRRLLESLKLAGDSFATPRAYTHGEGSKVLATAKERGLEGVVAKRRNSPYRPGQRSDDWIKVKNIRTQEVVLGGWTEGKGSRQGSLGALLLGIPSGDGLKYVGKVGTGFDERERRQLLAELSPLSVDAAPFTMKIPPADAAVAHYVRPELVGEVQFSEWTRDAHLRQPSWRGLRPDKSPSEVVRE